MEEGKESPGEDSSLRKKLCFLVMWLSSMVGSVWVRELIGNKDLWSANIATRCWVSFCEVCKAGRLSSTDLGPYLKQWGM